MDHPKQAPSAKGLQWYGWTDRGKVRANNEDSFLGLQFDAREVHHLGKHGEAGNSHADFVFAVSDGMGGAKAGEYASRIAIEKITKLLPRSFQQSASGMEAGFADVLEELFNQTHHALAYLGSCYEECHGMEATLSLCWFTPAWMYFAHVGDSRIYYLPAGEKNIKQLSHDDTHVGWLFRQGKISEREARDHPRRTVLQKALGGGNQFVDPQVGAVGYEAGDIFLICSDGLVEGFFNEQLPAVLRGAKKTAAKKSSGRKAPAANPARDLVTAAVEISGRDNTTALVIQAI